MPVYPKVRGGKKLRDVYRVVINYRGKTIEKIVNGTKAEAEAFEARERVALEVAGGVPDTRTAPGFSSFCVARYRPHAELHLRASTWKVRPYQLATLIEFFDEKKLTAFRAEDVEAFKRWRLEAKRKPRSINNELAVLQAVFTFARETKVPCSTFKIEHLPVVGRGRVTFWDDAQLQRLFASLETHAPELLGVCVYLANTGCRAGEALAAEADWINLKRGRIEIPVNEVWQPKDNEPREIPISDALRPWLERALARKERWIFPSRTGERFAYWPKLQFNRARKLAGRCGACREADPQGTKGARCKACAPQLRGGPHTLRHTFASHFLAACPDMYLLAKILGHSHERTSKVYSHLLPDHLARAKNAVNLAPGVGPAKLEAQKRWAKKA